MAAKRALDLEDVEDVEDELIATAPPKFKVKTEIGATLILTPECEFKTKFELVADFPVAVTEVTPNTAESSPAKSLAVNCGSLLAKSMAVNCGSISCQSSPAKSLEVFSPSARANKIKVPQMYFFI